MTLDELKQFAQENGERFWRDAGAHWLNDNFDLQAFNRVIEVGGYLGEWTDYIHTRYQCFVDTYEPVKEFAESMATRFSNRSKIEVINAGLERSAGEVRIAVMNDGSSLYNGYPDQGEFAKMLDAAEVVSKNHVVDLLALNCEGSEYNILDRLIETGDITKVRQLLVQFHVIHRDAEERRSAIRDNLSKTHSEGMSYPFTWEMWSRK